MFTESGFSFPQVESFSPFVTLFGCGYSGTGVGYSRSQSKSQCRRGLADPAILLHIIAHRYFILGKETAHCVSSTPQALPRSVAAVPAVFGDFVASRRCLILGKETARCASFGFLFYQSFRASSTAW